MHDEIVACFLIGHEDPQREHNWVADESLLYPLSASCERRGLKLTILNDCFKSGYRNGIHFITVPVCGNPYFYRWKIQADYLRSNEKIGRAFIVDSTDVVVQFNPFYNMEQGKIYVGDEFEVLSNKWIVENTFTEDIKEFIDQNKYTLLLNPGVIGSNAKTLVEIFDNITSYYQEKGEEYTMDMPIFNYIMWNKFSDRIERGRHVTTIFKSEENNSGAWFKHK